MKKLPGTIWTEERVKLLYKLYRELARPRPRGAGSWRAEIAARLGVSEYALIARLGRDYKAGRLKPSVAGSLAPPRSPDRREKITLALPSPQPLLHWVEKLQPSTGCQYPLWPHDARAPKPPLFCGAPVAYPGSRWCVEHLRKVWHRPPAESVQSTESGQRAAAVQSAENG